MPERPPHTSLLVERRPSDAANQQIWGLLGGHDGQTPRPVGEFGQDAGVIPLLFFEGHPGIFNDHRESGPRFNVSSVTSHTLIVFIAANRLCDYDKLCQQLSLCVPLLAH